MFTPFSLRIQLCFWWNMIIFINICLNTIVCCNHIDEICIATMKSQDRKGTWWGYLLQPMVMMMSYLKLSCHPQSSFFLFRHHFFWWIWLTYCIDERTISGNVCRDNYGLFSVDLCLTILLTYLGEQ